MCSEYLVCAIGALETDSHFILTKPREVLEFHRPGEPGIAIQGVGMHSGLIPEP